MSFPQYPRYRDSGVDWLGLVPAHWVISRLGFECETVVPMRDKPDNLSGEIPWLRIEDFDGKYVSASKSNHGVSRETVEAMSLKVLPVGTVLCSCSCSMGATAIVSTPLVTNQTFIGIVPHDGVYIPDYLYYLLAASQDYLTSISTGAIQTYLARDDFRQLRIPRPSTAEQSAIATFLDRECAKLDALMETQQRLMLLLKEKRQAVIWHAVTKGLAPDASLKPSGVNWLGEIPRHWRVVPLKRIARVRTGVAKGKDVQGQETITVPYLRVANVQDGYLDLDEVATIEIPREELERYALRSGDVLMNEGGDFDKLGRGYVWHGQINPCITQNHVFAVRPWAVSSDWLNAISGSLYAQYYFMSRSKQSTNLASISSTNLMELPVVLPPEQEQAFILKFIEEKTSTFATLITEAERSIELLKERRTALISAAVTGKIDVRGIRQESAEAA